MNAIVKQNGNVPLDPAIIESLVIGGDLSGLNNQQRVAYYRYRCEQVGLDPSAKPFDVLKLQGRTVLYANAGCTQQLCQLHGLSPVVKDKGIVDGIFVVTSHVKGKDGRETENMGAVPVGGLKGDLLANAMMKAVTKAHRRTILMHCGLGMLDETEVETIPNAQTVGRGSWRHEYAAMYSELQACGDEDTAIAWWHSSDTQEFVKRANEHHLAKGGVDYGSLLENEYMNLLPKLKKATVRNPMTERLVEEVRNYDAEQVSKVMKDAGASRPDVAPAGETITQESASEGGSNSLPAPEPSHEPDESEITPGERKEMDYLASVDSCDTAKELSAVRKNIEEDKAVLGETRYTALKRACVARMKEIEIGATLAA